MKTRYKILSGFVLLSFAALLMAAKLSNLTEVGRVGETNLFYVITNSAPGTWHQASISASNLLESFLTYPNWPASGSGSSFSENTLQIFVATNGNDSTAVLGDPSKPFLSIKSAFSNVVNDSAVIVGPGRFNYDAVVNTNGTTGLPITTATWFELVTNVTLVGSGPSTVFESGTDFGEFMVIREAANVTIRDFTLMNTNLSGPEIGTLGLTNANWSAIRPEGTNVNITITGVRFLNHTHQAVDHLFGPIRTKHLKVYHSWFESIGVTNVPGAVTHDGAAFVGVGSDWTFEDNVVTNCFRGVELIHTRTPADTVQHSGVRVRNNKFLGIWENAITTLSPYKDVLIENNLITRLSPTTETEGYGIKIAGGGSEFTIHKNTIVGWNHAIYSETSETNLVIKANNIINNGVGITLYVASGDGRKSQGHTVIDNFFQDISGPAIQIGGVNNRIQGNQFLNCKTNSTAGQGVVRMVNPATNIVLRGNWYRAYNSIDTNAYCISLTGENHKIQDEIFQDYKTSIYTGTAVGTTFDFNGIPVNSALAPTDGDVLTYDSATGVYTNKVSTGGSGTPAGANTQVQFNDGGAFGGLSNLMYYKASGTIIFSNNIGDGFVDFAAPVTFKSAITNEGPLYQLFPAIGDSDLIYRQPDGLLTTWSSIYDMVHTNSNSTNFVTDVTDVGTPASGDLIPIVDVSTASRKYVSISNLPTGSGDTNWVATSTEHASIENLYMTGPGPGIFTLFNSTETAALSMQMSEVPVGTNRIHWSLSTNTAAANQVFKIHSVTNTTSGTDLVVTNDTDSGAASAAAGTGAIQFAEGTSFNGTNTFRYDITNQVLHIPHFAADSNAVEIAGGGETLYIGPSFIGTASDDDFLLASSGDTVWRIKSASAGMLKGSLIPATSNSNDVGSVSFRVRTNWTSVVNTDRIASTNFSTITPGQVLGFHAADGTITNVTASASSEPTEWTVPITGTNFIIDWSAIGKTNALVLTNYAAAGILNTNVVSGNKITLKIIQGSQGFCTIVPNTNSFGPNWRYTAVQTGITQSTNGGYRDFIVLYGDNTNAVLSGQNWGVRP